MDALQFFWLRRDGLHAAGNELLDAPEADIRARPYGLHSIAWLMWHISRCEDVGVNRILVDGKQVLDAGSWIDRLQVPRRDIGTEMTDSEVGVLSEGIDLRALREYWQAVGERTDEIVGALHADNLDTRVGAEHLRRLIVEEGALDPRAQWAAEMWLRRPNRGWFLAQLALTHSWEHISSARVVRELLHQSVAGRSAVQAVSDFGYWKKDT
jgi:DinB superfamily